MGISSLKLLIRVLAKLREVVITLCPYSGTLKTYAEYSLRNSLESQLGALELAGCTAADDKTLVIGCAQS
jgi:hypothetical protein